MAGGLPASIHLGTATGIDHGCPPSATGPTGRVRLRYGVSRARTIPRLLIYRCDSPSSGECA